MLTNIIFGFILPWIFGCYLFKRNLSFVLHVSTIAALIAFLFNDIGHFMDWWYVLPKNYGTLSFIPYNLGVFAVIPVFALYQINNGGRTWLIIPLASFLLTIFEGLLVITGKVVYSSGWNLGWTYISYLIALIALYVIYSLTKSNT
ncbi:hypothetical protein [Paenibacillus macquariensis]|uniref:Uncharacterized protein n=1 Tax=Paenibacillus macquariensis TaxID=948756 RepID=A0ABY1KEY0_9BACL|nr:hypothetical protein [Paenibacillus macquariensis]OAB29597.1 hypothetical protein PMSM_23725 [Paenibacillus macquariensis subsp. macquariensis]SIR73623.1 hypothetical protein SAMN05421578_1536 [Paenibacillus macquariensis]